MEREQNSAFLIGKRLAELHMNALQSPENDDRRGGIIHDAAALTADAMGKTWRTIRKSNVLDTIEEEPENTQTLFSEINLSPIQLQHYHLLMCLEKLTVSLNVTSIC